MVDIKFLSLKISPRDVKSISNQIAEQITWLVASGEIRAGDKLPPTRKLAEFLKINQHTVRAAYIKLEQQQLIRTRQGAGSVVLEFDPLNLATRGTGNLSHTVGIIVPDLANPFYPALINGIEDVANENNILLITCSTQEQVQKGDSYLDLLVAKQVDGLIIAPYGVRFGNENMAESSNYQSSLIPTVYVDRPDEPGYSVLLDAEGAGFVATEHLIQVHGHERIGLITANINVPTLAQCFEGYKRALDTHGRPFDTSLIVEVELFSFKEGYRAVQKLLTDKHPPGAIFIAGDTLAIGAIRALHDHGFRVPEDISIIGYNNIDVADYIKPRLTSVHAPTYELGATSMRVLHRLIQGEEIEQKKTLLPTRLVIRDSCGCTKTALHSHHLRNQ